MSVAHKLSQQIEAIVVKRIAAERLVIPAMPTVATKCLSILREPNFNQRKLAEVIASEPMLFAAIMHEASTASFASSVRSIDQALTRLGSTKVKSVVVQYASIQVFQSPDKQIAAASRKIWEHSVAVSTLARDLGALTGASDAEECYVVGLLHDIGKPIAAAYLLAVERTLGKDSPGWIPRSEWESVIELSHRKIGVELAQTWKLPEDVCQAIADCGDYDAGERQRPANVVRLANAIAKRNGFATGPVDEADLDAMIMVGKSMLSVDDSVIASLANNLKERLQF
jgi:putative nucleotidyltransferase with HDIG domain